MVVKDARHTGRSDPRVWKSPRSVNRAVVLAVAVVVLFFLSALSVVVGAREIPVAEAVSALLSPGGALRSEVVNGAIVNGMRLPRTGFALLVGAALGLSGALMQALTRNPLGDPAILGISGGASFGVVVSTALLGIASLHGYIWFAFAGALVAMGVVYALSSIGHGGAAPAKLALAGVGVQAVLFSMTSTVLLLDEAALQRFNHWAVGSLINLDGALLVGIAPFLIVGTLLAFALAPALNNLALGEEVARSLGQRVGLVRLTGAAAVTVLAGSAVAVCGPIAFVGLIVPHVARAITGPDQRWVLAYSAVLGAVLLLGADILGRIVVRPDELQVGVVVALLGAPFFIAMVRRTHLPEL